MKLVTGGAYQGKREAACRLFGLRMEQFVDGRDCELSEIYTCKALCNFQEYIRRCLETESLDEQFTEKLCSQNPQLVLVSNEIGYGIVPIDPAERLWREQTGRICCQIAAVSDTVIRVVAGMPTVLKGEQKC